MLNIFAIDPAICTNPEWFKYCVEHCQPSMGRAIADLPDREWSKLALENINQCILNLSLKPIKAHGLKARLQRVRDRLVSRPNTEWDDLESSWKINAEKEHQRDPFALFISPEINESKPTNRLFHPDDLDESVVEWNTPNGKSITRSPNAFTDAVLPAIVVAKEIHIIDRFFSIDSTSSYTTNYTRIFHHLRQNSNKFPDITIHCCPDADIPPRHFSQGLNSIYKSIIPKNASLKCLIWKVAGGAVAQGAHPFHNRYILTNMLGIVVGYGTDSAASSTDATDTLQFLDKDVYIEKLKCCKKRLHPMVILRQDYEIIVQGEHLL